ncbi:MAG: aldo/keto reductase [Bacteroidales bacterium]|nr:aldo/keto reductase [Bacteroidales bacterium]
MKYNFLGDTGVLVSELCFGTMTFGGKGFWKPIGMQQQDEANRLIKKSFESGINFYDTANVYSEGKSEEILGQSFKTLGLNRQDLFVATKVRGRMGQGVNQVGLSRLHIQYSVEDSLRRLNMDHIDLLYIHGVDYYTPLEETMRGLEDVIRSGKVRYLGVSNHAAWEIMKANSFAQGYGWNRFEACQHYYSIASRDIERELIPMMKDQNLGLMPWSPLAGGYLTGKFSGNGDETVGARRAEFDFPPLDKEKADKVVEEMRKIANTKGVSIAQIALSWLLHQEAVTSVIIGAKHEEQLEDNLASTQIELSEDELNQLDEASALTMEYPEWMFQMQSRGRIPEED